MPEYFQHDYNSRNHPKMVALISDHGAAGMGIFYALVEYTHEVEHHGFKNHFEFQAIAKQMATTVEHVLNIVDDCVKKYNLLSVDQTGMIFSKRTLENLVKRDETRELRSKAGKASAEARKKKLAEANSTHVEHTGTHVEHNSTKESKVKEIKEKESKGNERINPSWEEFWTEVQRQNNSPAEHRNAGLPAKWLESKARTLWESYEGNTEPGQKWKKANGEFVNNWKSMSFKWAQWKKEWQAEQKQDPEHRGPGWTKLPNGGWAYDPKVKA